MIIDITHSVYTGMPSIPSDKHTKTEIKKISDINIDGIERHQILMSCHSGTHMDSPLHMLVGGKKLSDIPTESLFGKVKKISINTKGKLNYEITLEDVRDIKLDGVDFVILDTGWENNWDKGGYYTGHPYLSLEVTKYLIETNLKGVLVDLPSIDPYDSKEYPAHKLWLNKKDIIVENVCNLNKVQTDKIYNVVIAPLKLKDAEASPIRCFLID